MTHYEISIEGIDGTYRCPRGQTLLACLDRSGRQPIAVGCRGGGCGVCKVEIVSGRYLTGRMSREHVSGADEAAGVVLACQVQPLSDLVLRLHDFLRRRVAARTSFSHGGTAG